MGARPYGVEMPRASWSAAMSRSGSAARSAAFLPRLLGADVRFADLPTIEGQGAGFMLRQIAAVAALEARMISAGSQRLVRLDGG